MYISCSLCTFFRVGYAKITIRERNFWLDMGFNTSDHLVESRLVGFVEHLDSIQKRTFKCIDYNNHKHLGSEGLFVLYGLDRLSERQRAYHLALMYSLS